MKKSILLLTICISFASAKAQTVNYKDVAVIVNNNSPKSIEIGNYFKDKRDIPDENIITINCSTDERVDSAELFSIVRQVGDYLVSNGIDQSINYLVTTKGIPLIFEKANCDSFPENLKCSAIDSELTLLLNHEEQIGNSQGVPNPYFDNLDFTFTQEEYNIYLVTRLDGYTVDDIKGLIDRSGPDLKIDKKDAQFIFDYLDINDTASQPPLNFVLELGNELVRSKGWNSVYSPNPQTMVTDENHVLGYFSYIFQPSNKTLNYQWLPGSFAFQGIGETAFTFLKEENTYNDLIIANLVAEGVCGAAGTVVPYYLSQGTVWPQILFDRQTFNIELISETNPYFNLAESYYQALKVTSSSHVIIGDPKTSIILDDSEADTTLVLQPGPDKGKDATIWNNGTLTDPGNGESLVASIWINAGQPGLKRAYLQFDLSAIPKDVRIITARLSLYYNPSDTTEPFDYHSGMKEIIIQRVTTNWGEHNISWDDQPSTTTDLQVKLPPSTSPTQDYLDIDVSGLVIDMINPANDNNGFLIRMEDEVNILSSVLFASSDHSDSTLHPQLTVRWLINPSSTNNTKKPEIIFDVYPNPNRGAFNIRLPENSTSEFKISIFNSTGQKVSNYTLKNNQIKLSETGIFIVILSDQQGHYSSKKIIVL